MPGTTNRHFNLPEWAQQNYPTVAKIMQLVGRPLPDYDLGAAGTTLCSMPQQVINNLPDSNRQQLLRLLENLQLFQGKPLPQDVAPQNILMPGQPFQVAVEILRPLVGRNVSCVSDFRHYNPGQDGGMAYIASAIERFADTRWGQWFNHPRVPQNWNQYSLTSLAAMVASDGAYDLLDAFPGAITCWEGNMSIYTQLTGDPGETVVYGRVATPDTPPDDISYWMELMAASLDFEPSGSVVIATEPMLKETVGWHAQNTILAQWPDYTVDIVAPEIPEQDRASKLADAVQALGSQLLYAVQNDTPQS